MKLNFNKKVLVGKQTMKYYLMKYQIYSTHKTIFADTYGTRTKHCITQLNRTELRLKKSLMLINNYYINDNILLFIDLPLKWEKKFNSFLNIKKPCWFFYIGGKKISKDTYDRFLKISEGKPLLIVSFWKNWNCNKTPDIPVINFETTNDFTLGLLESSLRSKTKNDQHVQTFI